uniref:Syntaphilin n=1 Tax=Cyclopterus lumpus TaxID=8103 RepID=A0A8C2X8W4_CYCLU
HSDTSSTHTYPGRVRAAEGSPTARTRQAKHTACSDNHGIRPPTPEQYLTPLQQKEVCIRHLRSRLRDNVVSLQHRDCELDELRTQLYRMQEDWIEEECHRVEAQLALKEARKEIQHLQEVVYTVKSNLSAREQNPHDHKPYSGLHGARQGGKSRSCGCSPASTLSRSTTRTRLSSEALQPDQSSRASRPAGQTHLLLDAALLSEQLPPQGHVRGPPTVPRASTYERLCSGGAAAVATATTLTITCSCIYLRRRPRLQRELPPPILSRLLQQRRNQRCPNTCQPPATAPRPERQDTIVVDLEEEDEDDIEGTNEEDGHSPQLCHWSRYFLVDLLALAMPVVPTMAWLCRGASREVLPVYHIGSLLRGCCAVALHSLRRRGRRPTSMNGTTAI